MLSEIVALIKADSPRIQIAPENPSLVAEMLLSVIDALIDEVSRPSNPLRMKMVLAVLVAVFPEMVVSKVSVKMV